MMRDEPTGAEMYQAALDRLPSARREAQAELDRLCAALDRLTPPARRRLSVLQVRCPLRGCDLGSVYEMALRGGGHRYVLRGRTSGGKKKNGLLNWAYPDSFYAPVFYVTGCSHGMAKLGRGWLLDCVGSVRGWRREGETEEQFVSSLPPAMAQGRASRVFHPDGASWFPRYSAVLPSP